MSGHVVAAVLLTSTLLCAGGLWAYGRRLASTDRPDGHGAFSRTVSLACVAVVVLHLGVFFATGVHRRFAASVAAAAGVPGNGLLEGGLTATVPILVPAASVFVIALVQTGNVRRLRDGQLSRRRHAAKLSLLVGGFALTAVPAWAVVTMDAGGLLLPLVVGAAVVVQYAVSPYIVRRRLDTRPPTDAEADRLARLCDRAGMDPASVRVVSLGGDVVWTYLRGLPGRRHLFVSEHCLDMSDERLGGHLAIEAAKARLYRSERWLGLMTIWGVAGAFALSPPAWVAELDAYATGLGVMIACMALMWRSRRVVYRADADAAARTSPAAVIDALESLIADDNHQSDTGRLQQLAEAEPSHEQRLARLRSGTTAATEPATDSGQVPEE